MIGKLALTATAPLAAGVLLGVAALASSLGPPPPSAASTAAVADIPPVMLALYRRSAPACPGLSWTVLAAVGKVETDHNRGTAVSTAGARGPMQFLPSTWVGVPPVDGNGDGRTDIDDPADAVPTAARYLCTNGAGDPERLPEAIWAYNHSDTYVAQVLALAADYAATPPTSAAGADGLTPAATRIRQLVIDTYGITDIGGLARDGHATDSDHYTGRALDVMLTPRGPDNTALGWRIALYLQANAANLHIHYLIWQARIWNIDRATEGWRPYRHPSGKSNPTYDHLDHIHISVR